MTVRSKRDIRNLLLTFDEWAQWDDEANKFYLTLERASARATTSDKLTAMQYVYEGVFTVYRQSERVWDVKEVNVNIDELSRILWRWRKSLNKLQRRGEHV
jgi:tryptophan 2,3-dioxygenase